MIHLKPISIGLLLLAIGLVARDASAHGFELQQNAYLNPTAFNLISNQPLLDNENVNPTPAPSGWNIFTDEFNSGSTIDALGSNPTNAASYGTYEGFVEQDGSGPGGSAPIASATFKILSPLYYSDGTGSAAQPASAGTYLQIFDVLTTDPAYIANPSLYPGTSPTPYNNGLNNGPYINLTGTTSFAAGFSVSALYFHELEKDLYFGAGSTQTYGEYGFAFDVTVSLLNPFTYQPMTTLTTAPMVDVFDLTDPTLDFNAESNPNGGDFGDDAPQGQQDAATTFIYDAAISAAAPVPEPSSFVLFSLSVVLFGVVAVRRRRTHHAAALARSSSNKAASNPFWGRSL